MHLFLICSSIILQDLFTLKACYYMLSTLQPLFNCTFNSTNTRIRELL